LREKIATILYSKGFDAFRNQGVFSEIFLSIPQALFIHYPSYFPTHYQWYVFIFCDVFDPKRLKAERKAITPNR